MTHKLPNPRFVPLTVCKRSWQEEVDNSRGVWHLIEQITFKCFGVRMFVYVRREE